MSTASNRRFGLALAAAALVLGGCGGGGGAATKAGPAPGAPASASAPAPTPAKAAYIAQADAVCQSTRASLAQLHTQALALFALGDTPKAYSAAATLFRRVQSLEQGELTRLQALRPPAADVTPATGYLQAGTAAVALLGRVADAFARHDKPTLTALVHQGARMAATTKGLAQGYGFKVCGHSQAGDGLN